MLVLGELGVPEGHTVLWLQGLRVSMCPALASDQATGTWLHLDVEHLSQKVPSSVSAGFS